VFSKRGITLKKITGFILILLMISAVSCSRYKKYGDIRDFINEVAATEDEFLSQVDNAASADDVAAAVDNFGKKLIKLSENSREIKKKYPEIDKWVDNPPDELKLDLAKLDDTEGKFEKIFLKEKTKILLKDKKVQAAFIDLNKKMEMVKFFQ
jgi:hypothetical protein